MTNLEEIAKTAIKQEWLESERGWGQKPDGYSLHKNLADCQSYIDKYWEGMPKEVPDEYSRPTGKPYLAEINEEDWQELKESKNGIRRWR